MWTDHCFWIWTWNIGKEKKRIASSLLYFALWNAEVDLWFIHPLLSACWTWGVCIGLFVSVYMCDVEQRELWWFQRRNHGIKQSIWLPWKHLLVSRFLVLRWAAARLMRRAHKMAASALNLSLSLTIFMAFSSHNLNPCALSAWTFFHMPARSQWVNLVPCVM